jgi:hypothetical protein
MKGVPAFADAFRSPAESIQTSATTDRTLAFNCD